MGAETDPFWLDLSAESSAPMENEGVTGPEATDDHHVIVPPSHCMSLKLPYLPNSPRELVGFIHRSAPLRPAQLVWTGPIAEEGQGARIILARRDLLDRLVEDIERDGPAVERVYAGDMQLPFAYRTPRQRRRSKITVAFWIGAVATGLIAMLNLQSQDVLDPGPVLATGSPAIFPLETFSGSSLASDILSVLQLGVSEMDLSKIKRSRDGTLLLEFRTIEPDGMREMVAKGNLLPDFQEAGQRFGRDGDYLIEYRRRASGVAVPRARAALLQAVNPSEASRRVRESLADYAGGRVLQMNLGVPRLEQAGILVFPFELAGPQGDVVSMAERIESTSPPMRFAEWSLAPAEEGVRLSGLLYVPWQRTSS